MEKTCTVINEELEQYMIKHFPVGSEWLVPRRDQVFKILSHGRQDITPSWYANGPVQFLEPVCVAQNTAKCHGWTAEDNEWKDRPGEIAEFDFGTLVMLVKTGDLTEPSEWFELNQKFNSDLVDGECLKVLI